MACSCFGVCDNSVGWMSAYYQQIQPLNQLTQTLYIFSLMSYILVLAKDRVFDQLTQWSQVLAYSIFGISDNGLSDAQGCCKNL